jgi:uncharacterized protein (DUF1330 family)
MRLLNYPFTTENVINNMWAGSCRSLSNTVAGWDRHKIVVLAFPDRDSWQRWAMSEEYQEIAKNRIASTDGPILLVHGV